MGTGPKGQGPNPQDTDRTHGNTAGMGPRGDVQWGGDPTGAHHQDRTPPPRDGDPRDCPPPHSVPRIPPAPTSAGQPLVPLAGAAVALAEAAAQPGGALAGATDAVPPPAAGGGRAVGGPAAPPHLLLRLRPLALTAPAPTAHGAPWGGGGRVSPTAPTPPPPSDPIAPTPLPPSDRIDPCLTPQHPPHRPI